MNAILEDVDAQYAEFDESVYVLKCEPMGYYEFEDAFYVVEDDHIQEAIRMYEKSSKYYQSIAEGISKVKGMVDQAIARWKRMYDLK